MKIETYQQLSDIIEVIFFKWKELNNKEEFNADHEKIHKSFFNLKQKFPEYFNRLLFDENGHYPISEDLDSILQDFQFSGIINKLNPEFKNIKINDDPYLKDRLKKRKIDSISKDYVIERMAKELYI